MAKAADPLKAFRLPDRKMCLRSGQGAMKSKETPDKFLDRVIHKRSYAPAPFPALIGAVDGDLALAALYYGVDVPFLEDLCRANKDCATALTKAMAVKAAEQKKGRDAASVLKQQHLDEAARLPDLPTRSNWPRDDEARVEAYRRWLIEERALRLYEGDLVRVSEGGTIPLDVLMEMVRDDEVLASEREIGHMIAAERARHRMATIASTSNQPTAALKLLQAYEPEGRFKDKSQVDVRRVGFEAPAGDERDEDGELVSVLGNLRRVK